MLPFNVWLNIEIKAWICIYIISEWGLNLSYSLVVNPVSESAKWMYIWAVSPCCIRFIFGTGSSILLSPLCIGGRWLWGCISERGWGCSGWWSCSLRRLMSFRSFFSFLCRIPIRIQTSWVAYFEYFEYVLLYIFHRRSLCGKKCGKAISTYIIVLINI